MTAYRLRAYGSPDWTEIVLDGEMGEFAGEVLVAALAESDGLHLQERVEGEWVDL